MNDVEGVAERYKSREELSYSGSRPETPHLGRRRKHDHDIKWITVFPERRRKRTEIKRKYHPFRQDPSEHKTAGLGVVAEFDARSLRRFDNGPTNPCVAVQTQRQTC